jgi:hypothetical protein
MDDPLAVVAPASDPVRVRLHDERPENKRSEAYKTSVVQESECRTKVSESAGDTC